MWTPIEIFALTFMLNHSPMESDRLSLKEAIRSNENKSIIQSVNIRSEY